MKQLLSIALLLSLSIMSGCGGGSPDAVGSSTSNKYKGFWAPSDTGAYLKVDSKGAASLYTCDFTEGYKTDGITLGNITGDTLVPTAKGQNSVLLKLTNNGSDFSYTVNGVEQSYKKVNQIPSICTTDGIKITGISPATANEGVPTSFIISFTYQVESTSNAVIKAGFTAKENNRVELTDNELKVTKKGLSSGGMVVTGTPLIFDNGKPFKLHLVMQKAEDQGKDSITSIASYETVVKVNPKP